MLTVVTLSLSLVNPTCTATAESRDLQMAVTKARHELVVKGCDVAGAELKFERKVHPNGVTTYVVTLSSNLVQV